MQVLAATLMFSKKKRMVDETAAPGKKLCQNIIDLYGSGQISAGRAQSLLTDVAESGVDECSFGRSHLQMASNARARDVRQRCLADSNWPPLFQAIAPVKGRSGETEQCTLYFFFPHEVCHMWAQSDHKLLLSRKGLDKVSNEVLEGLCKELQLRRSSL